MKVTPESRRAVRRIMVIIAAQDFINYVKEKYPGEPFRCPHVAKLAAALDKLYEKDPS